jgi:hypothetical protein
VSVWPRLGVDALAAGVTTPTPQCAQCVGRVSTTHTRARVRTCACACACARTLAAPRCTHARREQVQVVYYLLPQETHLGRQAHHAARELFLGSQVRLSATRAARMPAYVPLACDAQTHALCVWCVAPLPD